MMTEQTSPEVSSIAAKYLAMDDDEMLAAVGLTEMTDELRAFFADFRTLAGSSLTQAPPAEPEPAPTEGAE